MKITLDNNVIQTIDLFQKITGATVMDCIVNGSIIYFIVAKGQYGLSVGKGGIKIKQAEKKFKKTIKVFEYSDNLEIFVKNLIPEIQSIKINEINKEIDVRVRSPDRAKIIGKEGRNIKIINQFLNRMTGIKELRVR
ncbi:MAG: NusA-like transcription termination signal-binding factor [Candidatus Aenigmarchaeota archaeon]|nr:NusA-like transcription termination signal-binding factor [Candidatus Aenigmarchaeota archaeon]